MAMVAFAVDMGWITHTQNELQAATDAAALAGASKLEDGYVLYYLPGQTDQTGVRNTALDGARAAARAYAGYNRAGDVASLALDDSDIEFGYTDSGGYTAQYRYTNGGYASLSTLSNFPNTVKVTLRRDNTPTSGSGEPTPNGPLGLFFARVLGINSVNLTASASATIYTGVVDGFSTAGVAPPATAVPGALPGGGTGPAGGSTNQVPSRLLPMTFDVNSWKNFLTTGKSPDGTVHTNAAATGPVIQVYPSPITMPGNFGELSLDQSNAGSSYINGWIDNGVTAADLTGDIALGLLPLSQHLVTTPDWKGNSGLKTSTIYTTENHVGEVFLLPLFRPVLPGPLLYQAGIGTGSNALYSIVQFVGIRIVDASDQAIIVQPAAVLDANALFTGVAPAAPPTAGSPLLTTFTVPKLTK
jgi:hypothetical protein